MEHYIIVKRKLRFAKLDGKRVVYCDEGLIFSRILPQLAWSNKTEAVGHRAYKILLRGGYFGGVWVGRL